MTEANRHDIERTLSRCCADAKALAGEIELHLQQPTLDVEEIRGKLASIEQAAGDGRARLDALLTDPQEEPQVWFFTFGCGQENAGRYVKLHGTFLQARIRMSERFGQRWSMQYPSADEAGVAKYGLIELHLSSPRSML